MNLQNTKRVHGSGRRLISILVTGLLFAACSKPVQAPSAQEIGKDTACILDGMLLADFPGPKAQIHYERGGPDFFCDTKEMFSILLHPEEKKRVVAVYTQDMGRADWAHPQDNWIDARTAFFVVGSKMMGSMGPTIGSFATEATAQTFASRNGGKVLRFDQVTLDMVDLSGGVMNDKSM
ncbi:MAG: nitrous oxide reductase accessory protein NosL [Rhodocyclaceae bacterium]|jgi:copper chaperone NosL|nr:nitrous oxide reductase accessory protein NosL [Rhodocyclaceae bacterium]